jgi:hypothetical protein
MSKIPSTDFDFSAEAEIAFDDWFHGIYGRFALRSEYFYGDCVPDDEENLKDSMYEWIRSSFMTGFERGKPAVFKPLPDSQGLRIIYQVAVSSAIEDQGEIFEIFAKLLYFYLTDRKLGVTLCDDPAG